MVETGLSLPSIILSNTVALWHKVSQSSNIQARAPGRPRLSTVDPLYCISRCHSLVTDASQVLQERVGVHLLLLHTDTFTFALLGINLFHIKKKKANGMP